MMISMLHFNFYFPVFLFAPLFNNFLANSGTTTSFLVFFDRSYFNLYLRNITTSNIARKNGDKERILQSSPQYKVDNLCMYVFNFFLFKK